MRYVVGFLLLVAGCGPASPGPPTDPAAAADRLRAALDAWKAGAAPEALQQQSPPVWCNDHEWRAGGKLLAYKLDAPAAHGRQARCAATLTLVTKAGRRAEQKVVYVIDVEPRCVIAREEL